MLFMRSLFSLFIFHLFFFFLRSVLSDYKHMHAEADIYNYNDLFFFCLVVFCVCSHDEHLIEQSVGWMVWLTVTHRLFQAEMLQHFEWIHSKFATLSRCRKFNFNKNHSKLPFSFVLVVKIPVKNNWHGIIIKFHVKLFKSFLLHTITPTKAKILKNGNKNSHFFFFFCCCIHDFVYRVDWQIWNCFFFVFLSASKQSFNIISSAVYLPVIEVLMHIVLNVVKL